MSIESIDKNQLLDQIHQFKEPYLFYASDLCIPGIIHYYIIDINLKTLNSFPKCIQQCIFQMDEHGHLFKIEN